MAALILDPGTPISALDDASENALVLSTSVCPDAACPLLHLDAVERVRGGRVDLAAVDPRDRLHFDLDVSTRRLEATDDGARTYLESGRGAWLGPWLDSNERLWRNRFEHLKGQIEDAPADARPAPEWKPGKRVAHRDLFPYDFAPVLQHGDETWVIVDACCPDPGCSCKEALLLFCGQGGDPVDVAGELGNRRPEQADARGRALWEALHADEELVEALRERREEIRAAGPFVVGAAYEEARLAARKQGGGPAAGDDAGGYLRGRAVPVALVRQLFDVSARLHAARIAVAEAWPGPFRVEATGAIVRDAWGDIDDEQWGFYLADAPYADRPWLEFLIVHRSAVGMGHRRQRMALGLPLLGGTALPVVHRVGRKFELDEPGADDVRLAVAVGEAILAATPGLVHEEITAPRVFERRVELDTGTVDVCLTASHADAPWDEEAQREDVGVDDLDDDDLDDEGVFDGGPGGTTHGADLVEDALEGFADAALDAGLAPGLVSLARTLVHELGVYVEEHHEGGRWFDEDCISGFLVDHGPRKGMLTAAEIDLAPAALRAVADWLGEVGHADAQSLRLTIDRALPAFRKRAGGERSGAAVSRSPTRWQPAPGQSPPAPTDPCGCGSGRRYKKCCMPR